ncbi:hypothetical protein BATDEDRAFT_27786 [Batrachochytrium dendrobatidis JAM81]|uniref:GAG-pre-integrase domain-containing protein n=1 Tax=Batrachochytrium dendrobatidis (strain JAM81 / FGSC 10211) TaxID=684364 RepID=F4PC36_BATDJ|nr:uncharacterized protein BATDEDRAFT_27786 [Batrachochytrium dendrobatidis JAM81]EGF77047.1 hypothetical protein BATDEDRAFT_27786 [Batrachochytrium dendrobatidis JAM81]|eukprot:XP_006682160.1 hypothetical protein BATDEDRAFT_27786 [Batrachochytrium dendrobatidis JAM81]
MSPAGSHAVKITDGLYVPRLNKANFSKWYISIEAVFEHYELWDSHVIAVPPEKAEKAFKIKEIKARGLICSTVSEEDYEEFTEDSHGTPLSARDSIAKIVKHFRTGNLIEIHGLEIKMQELTYNTDEGVKVLFEEMTKLRKALERMNVVTSNSEFFRKILWKLIDVSRHWVSMRKEFNDYSEKDFSTKPIKDMLVREEEDLIRAHELPKLQNAEVARLGHIGKGLILDLAKNVKGMEIIKNPVNTPIHICEACVEGQAHKKPFPVPNHRAYDWNVPTTLSKSKTTHPNIDNDSDDEMPFVNPNFSTTTTTPTSPPELIEDDYMTTESTTPTRTITDNVDPFARSYPSTFSPSHLPTSINRECSNVPSEDSIQLPPQIPRRGIFRNKQIHASLRESSLSGIRKPKANTKIVAESTQTIPNEAINASSPRIQELSQSDSEVEDTPLKANSWNQSYWPSYLRVL